MTTPKKGLAAYLEAAKAPDPLFADIQRHVMLKATLKEEGEEGRRIDCIHPSEAVKSDWCIRANYQRIVTNIMHNPRPTSFRMENIFQEGHNTHGKWQRWLTEMKELEGDWKCDSCREEWYEFAPENCPACGSYRFEYQELKLECPELMISGRTDGYLPKYRRLLEVKTMSYGGMKYEDPDFVAPYEMYHLGKSWVALENVWRDFRRPLRPARRQGQLYLWLARNLGLEVDEIQFIYDFKANQESKSFIVKFDQPVIDDILENASRIVDAVKSLEPPVCNIRGDEFCPACLPYEVADDCV